uniref:(northern house mosquito) hypothetical protein n=1 Tax=Culex pipiens TaxID=7175 RepID=A0A8D8FFL3_CULPI
MPCSSNTEYMYHQYLAKVNPSIPNAASFQCVKIALKNSTMNTRFIAGCGYKDVDYCQGWNVESLELITCELCDFECQKSYAEGLQLNLVGAMMIMMIALIL